MKNKKILFTLVALFAFVGAVMAQGNGKAKGKMKNKTPEERAEFKTQRMTKVLSLTVEQQPKVKEIHLTAENNLEAMRNDKKSKTISKEDAKAKRKEINKTRRESINALLDDQQKAKYEKWRKRRHHKMKGKGKGKGKKGDGDDDDNDDDDNNG